MRLCQMQRLARRPLATLLFGNAKYVAAMMVQVDLIARQPMRAFALEAVQLKRLQ